jgi:two-component system sensor histidine kinase/response regulator
MTHNPPSVLIVDDEEVVRDSCSHALAKVGYAVDVAEDGTIGLEKVEHLKPDLVLLDLKMPGMSGMDVLTKISEIDPSIVTVVITGYATVSSAVEAMKRGAYDFLPKPFTPDELRIIVKRGVEKRRLVLETRALQEERDLMKRNFITMVSHELRTPFAAILQYFEVILGGAAGEVPPEQRQILERMKIRIQGLLTLTRDWLNLAQIEKGKLVEEFQDLDLAPIISETVDLMREEAEAKKVTFDINLPDPLTTIRGDMRTLNQVFINLIANAIKYNVEGGKITITGREDDSNVLIDVSDTGIGISEKDLPFIFDEFYRVRTNGREGTGLGLSIARKIVEAHSGSISASSELNKGSTFVVSLPKARE